LGSRKIWASYQLSVPIWVDLGAWCPGGDIRCRLQLCASRRHNGFGRAYLLFGRPTSKTVDSQNTPLSTIPDNPSWFLHMIWMCLWRGFLAWPYSSSLAFQTEVFSIHDLGASTLTLIPPWVFDHTADRDRRFGWSESFDWLCWPT